MSEPAVLQAAQILTCEVSVCRLCTESSHSHVLVTFVYACACCLAGCSDLELYVVLCVVGCHSHVFRLFLMSVPAVTGCSHLELMVFGLPSVY